MIIIMMVEGLDLVVYCYIEYISNTHNHTNKVALNSKFIEIDLANFQVVLLLLQRKT